MRVHRAFTLVELLAVIAIMLVLMTVTFGMFSMFAERTGPDAVLSTVQALLHGARDYAATNGVVTRVKFTFDPNNLADGTTMTVEYHPVGSGSTVWEPIAGRRPQTLRNSMFVLKDLPDLGGIAMPEKASNPRDPSEMEAAIQRWKEYEIKLLDRVTDHAVSGSSVRNEHREFYVEFDPAGYMSPEPLSTTSKTVKQALTVVRLAGTKVTAYAFYPLNPNTGTRLVFE